MDNLKTAVIAYIVIINLAAYIFCAADKIKAKLHRRRISEVFLLALAFAGGSLGMLCSMLVFRHKTQKLKFTVTVPLLLLAHAALCYWLFVRSGLL